MGTGLSKLETTLPAQNAPPTLIILARLLSGLDLPFVGFKEWDNGLCCSTPALSSSSTLWKLTLDYGNSMSTTHSGQVLNSNFHSPILVDLRFNCTKEWDM